MEVLMKLHEKNNFIQSLVNDIRRNKKVSLLLGSAVSYSRDGTGVPNVPGVVRIIKDYIIENNLGTIEDLEEINGDNEYQDAFDFLLGVGDQNDVYNVIKSAVSKAKDSNTGEWIIPKAISDIVSLIKNKVMNIDYILTTNFDPLLRIALESANINVLTHVVDSDTNIETAISHKEGSISVIHLHGYWEGDTMHTPSQLSANRDKVKISIKAILDKSKLYVVGYGGWDDIFISSIGEIVNVHKAAYDIRWAFYSNSDGEILHQNKNLFSKMQQAIAKGRFQGFKNIDCHEIFESIYNSFTQVDKLSIETEVATNQQNYSNDIIPLRNLYKKKSSDSKLYLKEFKIFKENTHGYIREFEQSSARSFLEGSGRFHLESSWGGDKLGFISSILPENEHSYFCIRVDLTGVSTKDKAEKKFLEDIGCDITTVFTLELEPEFKLFILFDNIEHSNSDLKPFLIEVAHIVKDYKHIINAVFISNCQINLGCEIVRIKELSLVDLKTYIQTGQQNVILNREKIDKLFHLTSGLPAKINKAKEYLRVMSLDDLIEDGNITISDETISENIPHALLSKIIELSKSENKDNVRLFELLKIFSVLECGEKSKNIIRHFHSSGFNIDDIYRLDSLGLVYPIPKNDSVDLVIIKINPLVKDYIVKLLTTDELLSIHISCFGVVFGNNWRSSVVKISSTAKQMLNYQEFSPGNAHSLLVYTLRHSYSSGAIPELKSIIYTALSYCMYLNNSSQYKELVSFSREIFKLVKLDSDLHKYSVAYYLSEGLRMIDEESEAIEIVASVIESFKNCPAFDNSLYQNMLGTLSLSYSSSSNNLAFDYAKKLLECSPTKSQNRYLAESILAEKYTGDSRIRKLKKIERDARNNGHVLVANNVSLTLVSLISDNKDKYINIVLETESNTYTKIRALLVKAERMLKSNPDDFLRGQFLPGCIEAYRYLFVQRADSLFEKCHAILWEAFMKKGRFFDLYVLFKTSSLIWRLNGQYRTEFTYASVLRSIAINSLSIKVEYILFVNNRYDYIVNNKSELITGINYTEIPYN
jgi:hypothetical protein